MTSQKSHAQCLCGKVKISTLYANTKLHACHCDTCRRWGGGPLMSINCEGEVGICGEEYVSLYDSSEWAQRAFCKQCGSHLYYKIKQALIYYIPVGLFNDLTDISFEGQIFIDQKPAYYDFANQTRMLTADQVFAMFNTPDESE